MYKLSLKTTFYPSKNGEISIFRTKKSIKSYKIFKHNYDSNEKPYETSPLDILFLIHIYPSNIDEHILKPNKIYNLKTELNNYNTPWFYILRHPIITDIISFKINDKISQLIVWDEDRRKEIEDYIEQRNFRYIFGFSYKGFNGCSCRYCKIISNMP